MTAPVRPWPRLERCPRCLAIDHLVVHRCKVETPIPTPPFEPQERPQ